MKLGKALILILVIAAMTIAVAQVSPLTDPEAATSEDVMKRVKALETQVSKLQDRVAALERQLEPRFEKLK